MRERLLRESKLDLAQTDEICRSAESMHAQMKIVGDVAEAEANKVDQDQKPKGDQERIPNSWKPQKNHRKQGRHGKECLKCGYQHPEKLESCPAIGQECRKCGKWNHFASRCTSKEVKATDLEDNDEAGEMYQIEVAAVKLESGNFVRFLTRHWSPVQCATIKSL